MTKIFGAKAVAKALEDGELKDFALVSIRDNKKSPVYDKIDRLAEKMCVAIHIVNIHDICFGEKVPEEGIMPSVETIAPIMDFTKAHDKVAVHCTAGVSRSSAVAFLVEFQKTGNRHEAVKVLNPHIHYPNMEIIKAGCEIFEKDELVDPILDFHSLALSLTFASDNG